MKKMKIGAVILLSSFLMTSCYTSRVYHGNVSETTPQVEVASKSNPILLWGLLPLKGANQKASDSIGDRKDFTVKNTQTFIDGLLSCITLGIYTPTTTQYYVPVDSVNK